MHNSKNEISEKNVLLYLFFNIHNRLVSLCALHQLIFQDGRLLTHQFNYFNNWSPEYDTEGFCFDHEILVNENGTLSTSPSIALYGIATPGSDRINSRAIVSAYGKSN